MNGKCYHLLVLIGSLILVGQSEPVAGRTFDAHPWNNPLNPDAYVAGLAHRYLFETAIIAELEGLPNEIRGLSDQEEVLFVDYVIAMQFDERNASIEDRKMIGQMRAMHEILMAEDLCFLDVTPEKVVELIQSNASRFQAWDEQTASPQGCIYPWVSCSTATFPDKVYGANYSPLYYYKATSNDRVSNSSCEELACDYRLKYSSGAKKSYVSAQSTGAQCVLDKNGGALISSYSGGIEYVLAGYGTTAITCLTSVDTLKRDLLLVK